MRRDVVILIYTDVEVLDFAGPYEVFSVADELHDHRLFRVSLVAREKLPITAKNGLTVLPDSTMGEVEFPSIIVVPGGDGSKSEMNEPGTVSWLWTAVRGAEIVLCVCSGTRILAKAGLIDGWHVTTHHQVYDDLAALAPEALLVRGQRFVHSGNLVTIGGISAGIDGAFHVLRQIAGDAVVEATARYMEYMLRY